MTTEETITQELDTDAEYDAGWDQEINPTSGSDADAEEQTPEESEDNGPEDDQDTEKGSEDAGQSSEAEGGEAESKSSESKPNEGESEIAKLEQKLNSVVGRLDAHKADWKLREQKWEQENAELRRQLNSQREEEQAEALKIIPEELREDFKIIRPELQPLFLRDDLDGQMLRRALEENGASQAELFAYNVKVALDARQATAAVQSNWQEQALVSEIEAAVPGFVQTVKSKEFADWLDKQPAFIQKKSEDVDNPESAKWFLDQFNASKGAQPPPAPPEKPKGLSDKQKEKAKRAGGVKSSASPPPAQGSSKDNYDDGWNIPVD